MQTLIIHMHGIGDMIMFAPAFNKIIKNQKNIDLLIFENQSIQPIKNNNKIRRIYYCDKSYFLFFKNIVFLKKYDHVYFSYNSSPIKSLFAAFLIKAKTIKILSTFRIPKLIKKIKFLHVNQKTHKIYKNLSLISKINKKKINFNLNFKTDLENFIFNKKYFYIGIHPGSNSNNGDKRWSYRKYFKVIDECIKKKIKIYIFIGPYEKNLKKVFNKINSHYVTLVYNKKFNVVGSIIKKLNLFISNETGLAHLSSALNIKTILIISKTKDYDKTKISVPIKKVFILKKTSNDNDVITVLSQIKRY
jgi:ADP-heptose:LPS heptosyltransferase